MCVTPAKSGDTVQLVLYSTSACHLCEQAEVLVASVILEFRCALSKIDVVTSDLLMERYGQHIPVLARVEENNEPVELFWPFRKEDILRLISKNNL